MCGKVSYIVHSAKWNMNSVRKSVLYSAFWKLEHEECMKSVPIEFFLSWEHGLSNTALHTWYYFVGSESRNMHI